MTMKLDAGLREFRTQTRMHHFEKPRLHDTTCCQTGCQQVVKPV